MKIPIIVLLFLLAWGNRMYSQALVFPGSVWYHTVSGAFFGDNSVSYVKTVYSGDTLIGSEIFHILKGTKYSAQYPDWHLNPMYVRSDSERVYAWYPELDTTYMMYDFSAQLSDTWDYKFYDLYGDLNDDRITAIAKDTIIMNGRPLKRLKVSSAYPHSYCYETIYITERLGTGGYIFPMTTNVEGPVICRNCYYDYNWPLTKERGVDCTTLFAASTVNQNKDAANPIQLSKIAPNKWQLIFSQHNNIVGNFELYDVSGKLILSVQINSPNQEIPIPNPGMYIWRFIQEGNSAVSSGRIVNG
jgi:hypothetical protein